MSQLTMEDSSSGKVEDSRRILVIGAGVIGVSVTYHLCALGGTEVASSLTLVEQGSGPALAASGKAGGFLARDWCDGTPTQMLAQVGFDMHGLMAQELETMGLDAGYRRVRTWNVHAEQKEQMEEDLINRPPPTTSSDQSGDVGMSDAAHGTRRDPTGRTHEDSGSKTNHCKNWLHKDVVKRTAIMGEESTTAQVHPGLLVKSLLERAQQLGLRDVRYNAKVSGIHIEEAEKPSYDTDRNLGCIQVSLSSGEKIRAGRVIFCLGPWSHLLHSWGLNLPLTQAQKAHSVVLASAEDSKGKSEHSGVPNHALFVDYRYKRHDSRRWSSTSVEVYPRPDHTVYICGESEDICEGPGADILPEHVQPSPGSCDRLTATGRELSESLRPPALSPVRQQACFLPLSPDGLPLIGEVPSSAKRMFVATGHSCWGILTSLATGKSMAELILHGKSSCLDLTELAPSRFFTRSLRKGTKKGGL